MGECQMWILLLILILNQQRALTALDSCDGLKEQLVNCSSQFVACAINNSRPVTLCDSCVQSYLTMIETYHNMTELVDNKTHCMDRYVNLDRLQIVNTVYGNSINLWNDAKCYRCFQADNGSLTSIKSTEAQTFQEYYDHFSLCVSENNGSDTNLCPKCMENYTTLDGYFIGISNENEKIGTCMDLVDLMNTTRQFWSAHCCKYRRHNEYIFIISTLIVIVSTLCFYVLVQFCSVKKSPTILQQRRFAESFNINS